MSLWSAPLKALLFKSVLLLALPLVYRLSELCVLSVHPSGMLHRGDHSTAALRPNPLCSEVGCWDAWWSIRKITHHAGMEVCRENRQTFYFQSPKTHKKKSLGIPYTAQNLFTQTKIRHFILSFNPPICMRDHLSSSNWPIRWELQVGEDSRLTEMHIFFPAFEYQKGLILFFNIST